MLAEHTDEVIVNQGVRILLNRMDSNPDEFALPYDPKLKRIVSGRWDWVMEIVEERVHKKNDGYCGSQIAFAFLSDYEIDALYLKYIKLQGNTFTKSIMNELLQDGR